SRTIGLNFGEEVESIGLTVDGDMALNLNVIIDLLMSLSFNWDTDTVDFDINHLIFQGHASVDDIVVGAEIGPLRVSLGSDTCEKGVLALDLGATASYIDGVVDFVPTANTATEHNNYIDVQLPVYASLGDVTFGECDDPPLLSLSGTIFESAGGPALSFEQQNMEQLLDFSDFNLSSLFGIIQSTLEWLGTLTNADFMSYEIPIINKTLGELFDFATTFSDKILNNIDFEQINSIQDFIEQFTNAGILPPGLDVVYDPVNRVLNLPINFDFNLSDFNLRNLENIGELDYARLLDLGAINPEDLFDKDTILDGLLDLLQTPLDELARWGLFDINAFNPSTSLVISELESLGLIEAGDLAGTNISLSDLLNSEAVNVGLQELFEFDLLSESDLLSDRKISFDDLISSRLINIGELVELGLTLFGLDTDAMLSITDLETAGVIAAGALDSLGVSNISLGDLLDSPLVNVNEDDLAVAGLINGVLEAVDQASDAAFIDLDELTALRSHSLTDTLDMGFLSESEFDLTTLISIAALETAGLIEEDALDSLAITNIDLANLLASDLVSVGLSDLLGAILLSQSDVGRFDPAMLLAIADLETAGLIAAGALDSLGGPNISLGDLLDSDLVDVSIAQLITEILLDAGDITSLASVAAQNLDFEGFDLFDMVDLGMITQSHITSYSFDLFNIEDLPIDLGFDLGDVLELRTTATADARVTVEAGFE
ncbi:MAG: hypothetical protein GY869_17205, partial [Planctomycetes bacterium]|nr:hypothetical protein [Planctomycetota bacterium]